MNRFHYFFISILIIPFIFLVLAFFALITLFLPILVFFNPEILIQKDETDVNNIMIR